MSWLSSVTEGQGLKVYNFFYFILSFFTSMTNTLCIVVCVTVREMSMLEQKGDFLVCNRKKRRTVNLVKRGSQTWSKYVFDIFH